MASSAYFIWRVLTKKAAALLDMRSSLILPPPGVKGEGKKEEGGLTWVGGRRGFRCISFLRFYQDSGGPALLLSLWKWHCVIRYVCVWVCVHAWFNKGQKKKKAQGSNEAMKKEEKD